MPSAKRVTVGRLTAAQLIQEHESYWFRIGDDFSCYPMTEKDHRRGEKVTKEVHKRLEAYDANR